MAEEGRIAQIMRKRGWTPIESDNAYVTSELESIDDLVLGKVVMVATMQLPCGQWEVIGECNAWGQESVVYFGIEPECVPTPRAAVSALDLMYREYVPRA